MTNLFRLLAPTDLGDTKEAIYLHKELVDTNYRNIRAKPVANSIHNRGPGVRCSHRIPLVVFLLVLGDDQRSGPTALRFGALCRVIPRRTPNFHYLRCGHQILRSLVVTQHKSVGVRIPILHLRLCVHQRRHILGRSSGRSHSGLDVQPLLHCDDWFGSTLRQRRAKED